MRDKVIWITGISGFILACLERYRLASWLGIMGVFCLRLEWLEAAYASAMLDGYPKHECIHPKLLKCIFQKKAMGSGKSIPKEIVLLTYILVGSFVVAVTWMLITVIFLNNNVQYIGFGFLFLFVCVNGGLGIILGNICLYKIFIQKYKRLTWHNWMYMLGGDFSRRNLTKKIGGCEILSERKKGKHIYMTVRLNDTGEVFSDVILSGNKRQDEKKKYILYEICRVKYVY